jgi:site-specific recombinase XerD
MHIFFTGAEARKSEIPFLLDASMQPITAANAWLQELAQDGATSSPCSWKTYAYHLFDYFSYLEAHHLNWRQVSNDTVLQYRDVQDQNRSGHTKEHLNRRTINARIRTVGRFYAFAFEQGFIEKNPIKYKKLSFCRRPDTDFLAHIGSTREQEVPAVTFERLARPKIRWRPQHEIMQWLNSIEDWSDKLIAKLMYQTGMRREEVVNLKTWNLPERSGLDLSRPEASFIIIGKGRKKRLIYLATRSLLEIYDYIKTERALLVRGTAEKTDNIFVGRDGRPLQPGSINRIFDRVSKGCGIKIIPHLLRHSFAVAALQHWKELGVSQPEKLLQARLGHSSVITTHIYLHLTDDMKMAEAQANASLIEMFLQGEISETR